jgi:type VI secretion system secreted protein Hcp
MKTVTAWWSGLSLCAALATSLPTSAGGQSIYLTLRTANQKIEGGSIRRGHEGAMSCSSYEQSVIAVRDPATGLPTGRREYAPIVCRKAVDGASPLLAKALVENQSLEAEFAFYYTTPAGTEFASYAVNLKDARVVALRQFVAEGAPPTEEVSFNFRAIEWRSLDANVSYADPSARADVQGGTGPSRASAAR